MLGAAGGVDVTSEVVLRVEDLVRVYRVRRTGQALPAVAGVSLELRRGETLGIVGESGCGKSTLARLLVRLEEPTSGRIEVAGTDVTNLRGAELRAIRRRIQLVFQDPHSSLNPRIPIGRTLREVLDVHELRPPAERQVRVHELLDMVGLSPAFAGRYPHQLSGGQRQRVGIARALAVEPDVVVLDEPVSALDVSVRSGIMNLLARLRDELDVANVFISHDLAMVRHVSDRIAVMYLGRSAIGRSTRTPWPCSKRCRSPIPRSRRPGGSRRWPARCPTPPTNPRDVRSTRDAPSPRTCVGRSCPSSPSSLQTIAPCHVAARRVGRPDATVAHHKRSTRL